MDELKWLEYAHKVFAVAGWEICGVFIAQLLATRGTNVMKAVWRAFAEKRLPAIVWHGVTFTLAFCFSFASFQFKYMDYQAIAFVSFILASFNSAIVEWMFRKAAKHDTSNAIINKMVYMPEEELDGMTRIAAFASGVTVKVDKRKLRDEHEEDTGDDITDRREDTTRVMSPEETLNMTGKFKVEK